MSWFDNIPFLKSFLKTANSETITQKPEDQEPKKVDPIPGLIKEVESLHNIFDNMKMELEEIKNEVLKKNTNKTGFRKLFKNIKPKEGKIIQLLQDVKRKEVDIYYKIREVYSITTIIDYYLGDQSYAVKYGHVEEALKKFTQIVTNRIKSELNNRNYENYNDKNIKVLYEECMKEIKVFDDEYIIFNLDKLKKFLKDPTVFDPYKFKKKK